MWCAATLPRPCLPVSGSGALFSFHLQTLAMGSATAGITELTLSDMNGELIPATTAGAVYQVGHQVFLPLVLSQNSGDRQAGGAAGGSSRRVP